MRFALVIGIGVTVLTTAACSGSTSVTGACDGSGAAATVNATDGLVFSPSSATIAHGQAVCWQNIGIMPHTVTSYDGTSFSSGLAGGQMFLHTFPAAGSFPYRCTIHAGMTGTITVN